MPKIYDISLPIASGGVVYPDNPPIEIVPEKSIAKGQNVLSAAAWTYVAAAVSALGSWLFYVVLLLSQTRPMADRS